MFVTIDYDITSDTDFNDLYDNEINDLPADTKRERMTALFGEEEGDLIDVYVEGGMVPSLNEKILEKIYFATDYEASLAFKAGFPNLEVNVFTDRGGNRRISVGDVSLTIKN